ncbi:helix-turn-helix domain-containing protein [Hydrogenophaga sp. OTU3427]|uniref:helix-turn-helix domain-containing protein n=1 Tax=Hydrogenophaga sp. OTU3427 TaxID=3043856 RepID=UPI00313E82D2
MSTFANTLKSEIARVARKELKDEVQALRKATSAHRTEIAALKRDVKALAGLLKQAQRSAAKAAPEPKASEAEESTSRAGRTARFDAEKLAAHRAKLGISQAQMATLIGASALSVYKWESGKVQPRAAQAQQIAEALKLGKRAVVARLAETTPA